MVLTVSGDEWPVVVSNLRKDRRKWAGLSRMLCQEGGDTQTSDMFYKEAVQASLLFLSETGVMTSRTGRTLRGFHYRMAGSFSGDEAMMRHNGALGVLAFGGVDGGSRSKGSEYICPPPP